MPNKDGTGPDKKGPKTGKGKGNCDTPIKKTKRGKSRKG